MRFEVAGKDCFERCVALGLHARRLLNVPRTGHGQAQGMGRMGQLNTLHTSCCSLFRVKRLACAQIPHDRHKPVSQHTPVFPLCLKRLICVGMLMRDIDGRGGSVTIVGRATMGHVQMAISLCMARNRSRTLPRIVRKPLVDGTPQKGPIDLEQLSLVGDVDDSLEALC
jgi:hypothetical protein